MTYKAAGASNPNIKNVNSITYWVETNGTTTVKVNQTQYVGRYPTLDNAKDAVAGILIKLGNKDPVTRLAQILTVTNIIPNNDVPMPPANADVTPNALDWYDITHIRTFIRDSQTGEDISQEDSFSSFLQQVTGIDTNIILVPTFTSSTLQLWYRKANFPFASQQAYPPNLEPGYVQIASGDQIIVAPNEYIRFKCFFPLPTGRVNPINIDITNSSDGNALLDTFTMAYGQSFTYV
jgi:hypothetical protein